jgi:hypothetical protein
MSNQASDYLGYLRLVWRPEWAYNFPNKEALVASYRLTQDQLPTTYTFFHQDRPLFVLDPHSFTSLANKNRLTSTTARDVLGSILRLMQLRRTKATEMDIGGKTVHIRAEIPTYEIATVELKMSRA